MQEISKIARYDIHDLLIIYGISESDILRCCNNVSKYFATIRCGTNPDETWKICDEHMQDPNFYPYIKRSYTLISGS